MFLVPNTHVPDNSPANTLRIRIATTADMDEIMHLAVAASAENGFLPTDIGMLASDIWPALCQDHGICGVIGQPDGMIEGAVLLRTGTMWYSPDPVLEEKAVFVYPQFRSAKGGRARKLCEFSKQVSRQLGMPLIIGVLSNHRTEAKSRMYRRIFGEPAGVFFLYNSRTGEFADAPAQLGV